MNIKNVLERVLKRVPREFSSTLSVSTTAATSEWTYMNYSITVPSSHVYFIMVYNILRATNAPVDTNIGFHTSTDITTPKAPLYRYEPSVIGTIGPSRGGVFLLYPGTWYFYAKKNPPSFFYFKGIDFCI